MHNFKYIMVGDALSIPVVRSGTHHGSSQNEDATPQWHRDEKSSRNNGSSTFKSMHACMHAVSGSFLVAGFAAYSGLVPLVSAPTTTTSALCAYRTGREASGHPKKRPSFKSLDVSPEKLQERLRKG
jgi:hypothetical protein